MKYIFTLFLFFTLQYSFAQKDSTIQKHKKYAFTIIPSSLIGLGIYSRYDVPLGRNKVKTWRDKHFDGFYTNADDYLQFVPIGVAYGLGTFPNMKSKSDFINKSVMLVKSELLIASLVFPLKKVIGDRRPDTGSPNAWPSGHTTQAFVAASFLDHEYRHKSVWISVGAYACATSVAALRVLNDRHWSADVLGGAGIGILATHLVYLTHQYKWKNFTFLSDKDVVMIPYYQNRGGGITFSMQL